jgi:IS30 family transposase
LLPASLTPSEKKAIIHFDRSQTCFFNWGAAGKLEIKGGNHLGVIVTHVDKASKYLVAGLGRNKTAEVINQVTLGLFSEIRALDRKTMTFDNGKEFSGHATIAKALGVQCFFARPYHSWERGLNEHTNGL